MLASWPPSWARRAQAKHHFSKSWLVSGICDLGFFRCRKKLKQFFRTSGVKGEILLNNQRRGVQHRRLSCLIPQHTSFLENLTLRETLQVAAKLKLGCASKEKLYRCNTVGLKYYMLSRFYTFVLIWTKLLQILETCSILGLDGCLDTQVACLSGGERKRLSCAVELLSNPPLMFFDEPTRY